MPSLRTHRFVFRKARELGLSSEEITDIKQFLTVTRPDLKRYDAILLLNKISERREIHENPFEADFDFEPTTYWKKLLVTMHRQQKMPSDSTNVRAEEVHSAA